MRIEIDPADAGSRLDKLVVKAVPGLGRAAAAKLFEEGRVRVLASGETRARRVSKGDVAPPGGVLDIDFEDRGEAATPDPNATLNVVLETADVVVVDKPAGQPSAPLSQSEMGAVANALVARYPEMAKIGYLPREPGICHRLDTGTSGLLVAARTRSAFDVLTTAIKAGEVQKRYLLICAAEQLPETGSIELPLAPDPKNKGRVLACVHPRDVARLVPRPAVTTYRVIRTSGEWALVEASAAKAARHQLRAHFAAIEHPLAGDVLYGGKALDIGRDGHALHASYIAWHGSPALPAFALESPLPAELEGLLDQR